LLAIDTGLIRDQFRECLEAVPLLVEYMVQLLMDDESLKPEAFKAAEQRK